MFIALQLSVELGQNRKKITRDYHQTRIFMAVTNLLL